jgi:hypothetical protein
VSLTTIVTISFYYGPLPSVNSLHLVCAFSDEAAIAILHKPASTSYLLVCKRGQTAWLQSRWQIA